MLGLVLIHKSEATFTHSFLRFFVSKANFGRNI